MCLGNDDISKEFCEKRGEGEDKAPTGEEERSGQTENNSSYKKIYICVALTAYEMLLYNFFHLIFTAALGKLNSKSLLPHTGSSWRWIGFS